MEAVGSCSCSNENGVGVCSVCGGLQQNPSQVSSSQSYLSMTSSRNDGNYEGDTGSGFLIPRLIAGALSGALTGIFALEADFIEELIHGRFVQEQFAPAMFTAYRWQVNIADLSRDEIYDIFGEVASKGLSGDSLKNLPWHVITDNSNQDGSGESICCTICLQDIEQGETARSLPLCRHTFHLSCVDKWLIRHGSCPICRQDV